MKSLATVLLIAIGICSLFLTGRYIRRLANHSVNYQQVVYQGVTLVVAILLLLLNRLIHSGYHSTLTDGYLRAPTSHFGWLGIKNGTLWNEAIITFLIFPFIVTTTVVYFQVLRKAQVSLKRIFAVLPAALVLSVFNSFTEEIIFRVIGVEGLSSTLSVSTIAILSGVWFGLPHYFGTPGKLPGVFMAGFLGWIAAISILETGGIAVAWGIHFVQDVPIFTMLLAVAVKKTRH